VLREGETRASAAGDDGPLLTSVEVCPVCREPAGENYRGGVCHACGHVHKRLRVPTVASLLSTAFRRGVICVDELSMIRGEQSQRSHAIRGLRARHPLGATGTPSQLRRRPVPRVLVGAGQRKRPLALRLRRAREVPGRPLRDRDPDP